MSQKSENGSLLDNLGPGLLMAAAAIGVSHLVQSTRAGAEYGFALVWAVVLANLFKYPFLEYGPRYAVATGKSLLNGYAALGSWAIILFTLFTLGTMFTVQAAVTVVTASLAAEMTGLVLSPAVWSAVILAICISILISGRYSALDSAIKMIMIVLAISTVAALGVAILNADNVHAGMAPPDIWTVSGVSFLIALMGWMPIPLDGAVWHSIWTLERSKQQKRAPEMRASLLDFNIGYLGAAILALGFLSMGALVMFGSGESYAASGALFARQLITLYTESLGNWAYIVIIICAFTTMFSTTLTVTDAYPRVIRKLLEVTNIINSDTDALRLYRILLVMISLTSLLVLVFLGDQFRFLVDLATTLSFLIAPILAYLNYRVITDPAIPAELQPKPWLKLLSWAGLLFLTLFAALYLYWQLVR